MQDNIKHAISSKLFSNFLVFFLLVIGFFTFIKNYNSLDTIPHGINEFLGNGYFGWFDQGEYLKMAIDMSEFTLNHERFLYGPGYPIIGSIGIWLGLAKIDPFLCGGVMIYSLSIIAVYLSVKTLLNESKYKYIFSLMGVAIYIFLTPVLENTIVPWNSTINLLVISILLIITSTKEHLTYKLLILFSILTAWVFSARYVDVVWFFILVLFYIIITEYQDCKILLRKILFFSLSLIVFITPILYLNKTYFGEIYNTPYINHKDETGGNDQEVSRYSPKYILPSLQSIFLGTNSGVNTKLFPKTYVNESNINSNYPGLIIKYPWMLVYLISIVYFVIMKNKYLSILNGVVAISFLFYSSFPAFTGFNVIYGCLHYTKAWFPIMIITTIVFIAEVFFIVSKRNVK
ncbi:hypothetical protein IPJ91_03240 [bacterium]|nr:MAG: hypothetical protein IPJ91_03240 [bacterium]